MHVVNLLETGFYEGTLMNNDSFLEGKNWLLSPRGPSTHSSQVLRVIVWVKFAGSRYASILNFDLDNGVLIFNNCGGFFLQGDGKTSLEQLLQMRILQVVLDGRLSRLIRGRGKSLRPVIQAFHFI